jgi:branched-subunit amino acid aminotransferase/4-amino-4-deoxychorismate lyase
MISWRWQQDAFLPCDSIPLADRGFRYGMSFFESFPIVDSRPMHLEAHLARLRDACAEHDFPCDDAALRAVRPHLHVAGHDGWARLYVTAGAGPATAPAKDGGVYLLVEARPRSSAPTAYDVQLADEICHPLFGGMKTANYWANLNTLRRAERNGAHEALLFNERAELVSACCANVFVVRDGIVRTPNAACGARRGVIRELVLKRMSVEETSLFVHDVLQSDEIFLTNSWIQVMPVATVQGRELSSQTVALSLRDL